jgi:hypothetical protein
MGPGLMMGPGMMGSGRSSRLCSPGAAGFAEWRIARIEQAIQPTEAQRTKLDEFKQASLKAAEIIRAACPSEFPVTPTAMMALMEKRTEAMLLAIKTMRPALDAFYESLDEKQKTQLSAAGPRARRFWRWREQW